MISITLCMIVKNESQNLSRCLESAKDFVDEIIVVDTGSEDNTVEIARSYGAKVSFFKWCNDFAAARNYSLSLATSDWILVLDADEQIIVDSALNIQSIHDFLCSEADAYKLHVQDVNLDHLVSPYIVRLFRNAPNIKYKGLFHEFPSFQCVKRLDQVSILHYGYSQDLIIEKDIHRNIPLLEKARQDGNLELRLLICLENMYRKYNYDEKLSECSEEVWEQLLPSLLNLTPPSDTSYIPQFLFNYGVKALELKDLDVVCLIVQNSEAWLSDYPPLIYLAGATLRHMGFLRGAIAYYQMCIQMQDGDYSSEYQFERAYMNVYPAYDLGCVYHEMGDIQAAIASFQLALEFQPDFAQAHEYLQKLK